MDMESILFHGQGETMTISRDDSTLSAQPPPTSPIDVPNREKLDVLLEHFPTFTNMEPSAFHTNELFLVLERIPVDVIVDPS